MIEKWEIYCLHGFLFELMCAYVVLLLNALLMIINLDWVQLLLVAFCSPRLSGFERAMDINSYFS